MTKNEFLTQLERHLRALPANERSDAVEYFEGYISDAGEDESTAIEQLDSPAQAAAKIIAEYTIRENPKADKPKRLGLSIAWAVILAVFAAPIALPIALAVACVALALIIVIISLIVAFGAAAFGTVVAGAGSFIIGVIALFQNIPLAMMMLGSALAALGIGMLLTNLTIAISKSGFRSVAKIVSKVIIRRSN